MTTKAPYTSEDEIRKDYEDGIKKIQENRGGAHASSMAMNDLRRWFEKEIDNFRKVSIMLDYNPSSVPELKEIFSEEMDKYVEETPENFDARNKLASWYASQYRRLSRPKWPQVVDVYVFSDKDTNWEFGESIGLSEDAIKCFKHALSEVKVKLSVNEDGTYRILEFSEDF